MGLSVVAAHIVFAGAFLFWGTMYLDAQDTAADAVAAAERDAAQRRHAVLAGEVSLKSQSYSPGQGGQWTVVLENTGDRALDAGRIDLLADGAYVTHKISSTTVVGGTGDFWPPGYDATFLLTDLKPRPDRLVVADDLGGVYVEVV